MMSSADDESTIGYATAAELYLKAGWKGILPMRRGHKGGEGSGLPTGFTGRAGVDPSYPDILEWSAMEHYRLGNLCLRLPNDDKIAVIGIDVDAYGVKTGAAALAEAERRWGRLPGGPRTSSRLNDPTSGIRLFRIPPGVELQQWVVFPDLGIGDIEICQHHHRYVMAWPSIHPEGRTYQWRDERMNFIDIPRPDELPWLPQEWIANLCREAKSNLYTGASVDVNKALTTGGPTPQVSDRLRQAIKELNLPGQSRHDTTCRHVLALMRLGVSGHAGVKHALDVLEGVFTAVVVADGSRSSESAGSEFKRMIHNDNAARELAQPGINDWFNALAIENGSGPEQAEKQPKEPENSAGKPVSPLREIEQGFWESRESLAMIYQTALSRMCPPWAVLAHTAARALTMVRPHVTLPPLIGGRGSLNWFAAVVARSGGGKGASSACAELLIPEHVETRNVGSGEGIVTAFGRPGEGEESPMYEALMFTADEVDTLAAMNQRSASTTLSILRSGFSGETLGFSYAAKEKRRHIGRHTYRMTFVVSIQPTRAGWLLADASGGTPQRFMWFPGTDARISKDRPWESGPLELPPMSEWLYPREIVIPKAAADLILDERVKAMRGDQTALDGHALFCREKFAYALAVLDGRVVMTDEDWELSGIVSDVSAWVRQQTIDEVREASRIEALDRGELRGIELSAADDAKELESAEKTRRVLRWLLDKLGEAGEEGMAPRDLSRAIAGRDRRYLSHALGVAQSNGLIAIADGTSNWVRL